MLQLSAFPFDLVGVIVGSRALHTAGILRLLRLLRVVKLIRILKALRILDLLEDLIGVPYVLRTINRLLILACVTVHWVRMSLCIRGLAFIIFKFLLLFFSSHVLQTYCSITTHELK
jgi:hypothetical protein